MQEIKKEYLKINISELKPYEKNNKKHTKKDIDEVVKSIKESSYIAPIIVDENNVLLVWHWRLEALKKLKYKEVEVIQVSWLSEEQKKKYRIKDNTTSLFSEFDFENILQEVLSLWEEWVDLVSHLEWLDIFSGLNFFQNEEFIEEIQDEVPELPEEEKIEVKSWDIFKLWNHYLMCWSSTSSADIEKLMNWNKADCVVTDPPYLMNFQWAMHWDWKKESKHKKIENDDLKWAEWQKFLEDFLFQVKKYCSWSFYIFFYRLWIDKMFKALEAQNMRWRNLIIWKKEHFNLSPTDYKSIYEPIIHWWADDYQPIFYWWNEEHNFYWKKWEADFINDFQISSVLENNRTRKNDLHPTMKPIELLEKILNNSTKTGGKVLDLFGWSGSTLIACEKKQRVCYMMELTPEYCQTIIKRFYQVTGWSKNIECLNRQIDFSFLSN